MAFLVKLLPLNCSILDHRPIATSTKRRTSTADQLRTRGQPEGLDPDGPVAFPLLTSKKSQKKVDYGACVVFGGNLRMLTCSSLRDPILCVCRLPSVHHHLLICQSHLIFSLFASNLKREDFFQLNWQSLRNHQVQQVVLFSLQRWRKIFFINLMGGHTLFSPSLFCSLACCRWTKYPRGMPTSDSVWIKLY